MKTNNHTLLNKGMEQVRKYDPDLAKQMTGSAWEVNFIETGRESCVRALGKTESQSMLSEVGHALAVTDIITGITFFSNKNVRGDAAYASLDIALVYAQTLVHEFVHFNGKDEGPAYIAGMEFADKTSNDNLKAYTSQIAANYITAVLSGTY